MLPLPSRSYTRPSTLAVLVVTPGIFSMHAQSTYRGRGKGADRIYPIPELNTVTQSTANTEPDLLPDADVAEGLLSEPLKRFALPSVSGDTQPSPLRVKNFRYIGSYNWLDAPRPTIIVPGSPGIWRNPPVPFRVPFDKGFQIFDPNGYYMGSSSSSPLIPLFHAVDVVAEDNADTSMDWPAIDIVADRSSLRKLLRWIKYSDSRERVSKYSDSYPSANLHEFRIDLQLGGAKTVLMQRWDTRTCQYVTPPNFGCRVNFEKATVSPAPGCESGSDHYRIVQYELGGLQMVVRFEADALIAPPTTSSRSADNLSDALAGLSLACQTLSPPGMPALTSPDNPLPDATITVVRGGTQVPQSSVLEISTCSTKGVQRHNWEETCTQLFLSQTPLHCLAIHERGQFKTVTTHPLNSPEFQSIADQGSVQRNFKQLIHLLREIQALIAEHSRRRQLSLVCRDGQLEAFERSDGNDVGCLPDSELARFGL